jgi:dipeptidase D
MREKVSKDLANKLHQLSIHYFREISKIPRGSGKEEKAADYLVEFAKERGLAYKRTTDIVNNKQTCTVAIYKPGTPGYEAASPLVLQAHIDMVCQKEPDSTHDFEKDPIEIIVEGNIMRANKTTLGADNGIGVGIIMAFLDNNEISHPPLEALFTSDEEDGMSGVIAVTPDMLTGKKMINIDSGDEGKFTYGSAGGINCDISFPVTYEAIPSEYTLAHLGISGLLGGHSGVEIHKGRGNAHLLLARTLTTLQKTTPLQIGNFTGGGKRNVITREVGSVIAFPSSLEDAVRDTLKEMNNVFNHEYADIESGVKVDLIDCLDRDNLILGKALDRDSTKKVIALMMAVPNDVMAMHNQIPDLVGTSCNLGVIELTDTQFRILSSVRSSHISKKYYIVDKFESIATLLGGKFTTSSDYPSWEPNINSPLLNCFREVYQDTFTDKEPVFEAIHAGLECGFVSEKFPGMDIISCGPTMEEIHTPKERLHVDTNLRVVELLLNVMLSTKE